MSISTYSELKTAIANFLARDDLTAQIPDFIRLAEARVSRELETREQEKRATASLEVGDEYIALPTDLREVREVKLNTSPITVLEYQSPHGLDKSYTSAGNGRPRAYSVVGLEMKMRPVPDSAYTAEIVYIGSLPALSDTNTPIAFTRHPDLYLYGALTEAYTYLLDEARSAQYDSKFGRIIAEIKVDEERSQYGVGSLAIRSDYQRQQAAAES
ncbi:MAG: hypothetical protein VW014_00190 [Halieaceae bacterium]|jgi:hypothetical protein